MLKRIIPDRFIWVLIGTIALANVFPLRGATADAANGVSSAAIFLIFLLHGIRLPRHEIIAGLANFRLQGAIMAFVFIAMGAAGLALSRVADGHIDPTLALGLLYLGVLPSTVQSATTYCHLAGGSVAVSVVASATINLAAVAVTPLLFTLGAGGAGGTTLSGDLALRIVAILLAPFILGQSLQRRLRPVALRHPAAVRLLDQGAIAIAVYVAFSAAIVGGQIQQMSAGDTALLLAAIAVMLAFGFLGAWHLGRVMRLTPADRIAMLFSGSHKSIAVGAPLATLLFPPAIAGMVLAPVLIYHLLQLVISAWLVAPLRRYVGADAR